MERMKHLLEGELLLVLLKMNSKVLGVLGRLSPVVGRKSGFEDFPNLRFELLDIESTNCDLLVPFERGAGL